MRTRYKGVNLFTVDDPRISPCPTTGCWLWTGYINDSGYGETNIASAGRWRHAKAHRMTWEKVHGPIPDGMHVDHICRERSCVNPDHLRVVTPRENALYNSVSPFAKRHKLPACPRCGGAFDTALRSTGRERRWCRACQNACVRRRYAASPEMREKLRARCRAYHAKVVSKRRSAE